MIKNTIVAILGLVLILSCSKDGNAESNALVGTWVFTNQVTNSYAFPSVLTNNSSPIANSAWSTSVDSIKIAFDGSGNYQFWNFHLPVDNGKYRIVQDSFIIIQPDTADFVKFNYSSPSFSVGSGVPSNASYAPYSNFHFSTDTILFKKTNNDNIIFSGAWLTKAASPLIPSNDTLILNQSLNHFKRK